MYDEKSKIRTMKYMKEKDAAAPDEIDAYNKAIADIENGDIITLEDINLND